jgi:ribosomal protein L32
MKTNKVNASSFEPCDSCGKDKHIDSDGLCMECKQTISETECENCGELKVYRMFEVANSHDIIERLTCLECETN